MAGQKGAHSLSSPSILRYPQELILRKAQQFEKVRLHRHKRKLVPYVEEPLLFMPEPDASIPYIIFAINHF